jgi:hypothetical protein
MSKGMRITSARDIPVYDMAKGMAIKMRGN